MFDFVPNFKEYENALYCFSGGNLQTYEAFDDYVKHFLFLIGYEHLEFQKRGHDGEISFSQKTKMMKEFFTKEVLRISGEKNIDLDSIYNPIFKWGYFAVLHQFLLIYGKYFYFNKPEEQIKEIYNQYLDENIEDLFFGKGDLSDTTYRFLEPFLLKPKSLLFREKKNHKDLINCKWCGSSYNISSGNCTQCGGYN